ncbi:hypothetical protein [Compostibacter hankyongensis]|uniref:DUF2474 domain-containing protein n=1 Tax=Compostibacter hankyongensis TaxID=1007089 RepID=A0ABP8FJZ2_9BACT
MTHDPNKTEDKPPVFKAWGIWYLLVAGWLGLLIVLFYLFTKHFS